MKQRQWAVAVATSPVTLLIDAGSRDEAARKALVHAGTMFPNGVWYVHGIPSIIHDVKDHHER